MIHGLYLSATGVLTNSYRQDVIANNIANAETVGFKKDLATFMERRTEAQARGLGPSSTNPLLEPLGGGIFVAPTVVDVAQGDLEPSSNSLDTAIQGHGFFQVNDQGKTMLTRDGRFSVNHDGQLVLPGGQQLLDVNGKAIQVDPSLVGSQTSITPLGQVVQGDQAVAQLALVDVPNPALLTKRGANLMDYPDMKQATAATNATLRSGFTERANVDPATELTQLMDAQRQLEANANMIRYQDQTLQRLCNDVGKIG